MQESHLGWPRGSVSISALRLLACLHRRGGSMRIHVLLRSCGLATDALCDVLNELQERDWIRMRRRSSRSDVPERLREVDRVTATHEGRLFTPRFWVVD